MISRVYTVLMPSNGTTDVEVPVEAVSEQTTVGDDGFYAEWRNRPIRVPIKSGNTGFVPRFRLGFNFGFAQHDGVQNGEFPLIEFSASLVGNVLSAINGATTLGDNGYADPSAGPAIKIINSGQVGGRLFRLYLQVMEAEDEDRTGQVG